MKCETRTRATEKWTARVESAGPLGRPGRLRASQIKRRAAPDKLAGYNQAAACPQTQACAAASPWTNHGNSKAKHGYAANKSTARVEPAEPLGRFGKPCASQTPWRTAHADSLDFLHSAMCARNSAHALLRRGRATANEMRDTDTRRRKMDDECRPNRVVGATLQALCFANCLASRSHKLAGFRSSGNLPANSGTCRRFAAGRATANGTRDTDTRRPKNGRRVPSQPSRWGGWADPVLRKIVGERFGLQPLPVRGLCFRQTSTGARRVSCHGKSGRLHGETQARRTTRMRSYRWTRQHVGKRTD